MKNLEVNQMKKNFEEIIRNYQGGDLDLSGCEMKTLELGQIEGSLNLSKATLPATAAAPTPKTTLANPCFFAIVLSSNSRIKMQSTL